jgi:Ser/Thr protein kinase RdoA (MazF antagonist)
MNLSQSFYQLTPEVVLSGVENAGFLTTGEYVQLNSYENRVFDVFLERGSLRAQELNGRIISKFYRPNRWTAEALKEEHQFELELAEQGQPIIAPLRLPNGDTLGVESGLYYSVFPKCFGRMPQELSREELKSVGRLIARMHNCGEQKDFEHRLWLTPDELGWPALDHVSEFAAPEVWARYEEAAMHILRWLDARLDDRDYIRVHGDCHKGNLLQTDSTAGEKQFFFVDFDDTMMGPAAQDLWMLFSGDRETAQVEVDAILSGYEELRHFPEDQLTLFQGLRGLRIIQYGGWIAKRWADPAFPHIFPQFRDYTYWAEEVEALEKIAWSL